MGVQVTNQQRSQRPRRVTRNASQLSTRIRHGRAVNAVAAYLRASLRVPVIYLEPQIRRGTSVIDVLAVDAAGSGDVHIVEAKVPNNFVSSLANLQAYLQALRVFPSHYKWLVLPHTPASEKLSAHPSLFAPNGIGRVGVLLLAEEANTSDLPQITPIVKAERFRVSVDELAPVLNFVDRHQPDIEVRV